MRTSRPDKVLYCFYTLAVVGLIGFLCLGIFYVMPVEMERRYQEGHQQGQLKGEQIAKGTPLTLDDLPKGQSIYSYHVGVIGKKTLQRVVISPEKQGILETRKPLPKVFRIGKDHKGKMSIQELVHEPKGTWTVATVTAMDEYK